MIYSPIACSEEHGTAKENMEADKTTCSVVLRCAWADRWTLAGDLIGNRRVWPALAGWDFPPRAKTVGMQPALTDYDTVGQGCVYLDALLSVNYTNEVNKGDGNDPEDLLAESLEPTVEFLKQDYRRYRWGSETGDPLLEGEAPGRQLRGLNLVRTLYKMRPPLPTSLLSLGGTVNSTRYYSRLLGLSFDAQTLLFNPPQLNRKVTTDGSEGFDVTLKHTYKPEGWNRYWRQKTQQYEQIFDLEGNLVENYPPANHAGFLY